MAVDPARPSGYRRRLPPRDGPARQLGADDDGRPLRRAGVIRAHGATAPAAPRARPARRRARDLPMGTLTRQAENADQPRLPIHSYARELDPRPLPLP